MSADGVALMPSQYRPSGEGMGMTLLAAAVVETGSPQYGSMTSSCVVAVELL